MSHEIYRMFYDAEDPRLGRHVFHDSRSLDFQVDPVPISSLVTTRHHSCMPTLNQGNLGSCVGNSGTKVLSYDTKFWDLVSSVLSETDANLDEKYAVQLYSDCTEADDAPGTYPPTDTGSSGLACAKVLFKRGVIGGYLHATSLEAVLTALQKQAVIVGTKWLGDMFRPDQYGRLKVTGSVAGGHEYVLDEVNVEDKLIGMQNSWGNDWGVDNGRAYMSWDDFGSLLADRGDCTVFTAVNEPKPVPTPAPPEPPSADEQFAISAHNWLGRGPWFYKKMQAATEDWLKAKGL